MFKRTTTNLNCLELTKKVNNGKMRFDLEIQRRSVWSDEQKQNLIDSLVFDYPIPPVFIVDKNTDCDYVLDGQQRSRAVTSFFNDEFVLAETIPNFVEDGTEYELKGKKYSELHDSLRNKLNATNLTVNTFSNISDEEIKLMFKRLNGGASFKAIELTRIEMPTSLTAFVNTTSKDTFFTNKVMLSDKAKVHFADQELILQTLMLFTEQDAGFSGKEIKEFVMKEELTQEQKDNFSLILTYVNEAFAEKNKYLKRANIPVLFKVAETAFNKGLSAIDYGTFANDFFSKQRSGSPYTATCTSGSAKKGNVEKRLKIFADAFEKTYPTK